MQFPICKGICGLPQDPKFSHCNYCIALANTNPEMKTKLFKKKQEQREEHHRQKVRDAETNVVDWQRHLSQCIEKHRRAMALSLSTSESCDEVDLFAIMKGHKGGFDKSSTNLVKLQHEVEKARNGLAEAKAWLSELKSAFKLAPTPTASVVIVESKPIVRLAPKVVTEPVDKTFARTESLTDFPILA